MKVRGFTLFREGAPFSHCDVDRNSGSFPLILEKQAGFAAFAVENLR